MVPSTDKDEGVVESIPHQGVEGLRIKGVADSRGSLNQHERLRCCVVRVAEPSPNLWLQPTDAHEDCVHLRLVVRTGGIGGHHQGLRVPVGQILLQPAIDAASLAHNHPPALLERMNDLVVGDALGKARQATQVVRPRPHPFDSIPCGEHLEGVASSPSSKRANTTLASASFLAFIGPVHEDVRSDAERSPSP